VKFDDSEEEVSWVAGDIKRLIDAGVRPPGKFIVIAGRPKIREALKDQLHNLGLESCDLREDVALDSTRVKVSTVEGAKGHESPCIYICGVIEGIFPPQSYLGVDEERLHASRLYVAMTRATDRLVITWSVTDGRQMNRPSRFLSRMQNLFEEFRFRDGEIVKLMDYEE